MSGHVGNPLFLVCHSFFFLNRCHVLYGLEHHVRFSLRANKNFSVSTGHWRQREMSSSAAVYLARRAAQKERVRILYRRALKDTLNWAVHRHLFYRDADALRERFDVNKNVDGLETIDQLIADGEAAYNKWRHPDPYIVPWAPGGSKFTRNPEPPTGIEIVYDYGREEPA